MVAYGKLILTIASLMETNSTQLIILILMIANLMETNSTQLIILPSAPPHMLVAIVAQHERSKWHGIHPVRNPRFASFRTQPLDNLSAAVKIPIEKRFLGNPTLGTNPGSRILAMRTGHSTANPRTNIMDFRGFDSSTILILRVGILTSMGNSRKVGVKQS